jgi:predicted negative regulator of RcsB-dependent stress response
MDDRPASLPTSPSTAARPDLDWSQVRETILMLNLAMAQIEMALKDSSGSVEVLTNSFTGMYGNLMALVEAAHALPDSPVKHSIEETGGAVSGQMQHAIVAFQFYDRLTQRLSHVCRSLEDLSGIVNDPSQLYNPYAWHALQQKIRAKYTMEDEKLMFDTLVRTGNVQEALEHYLNARQEHAGDNSDIELF